MTDFAARRSSQNSRCASSTTPASGNSPPRTQKAAFRAAHTLKGVCLNLGFDRLYEVSSALTEMLRDGVMDGSDDMLRQVEERYDQTVAVLREFKG